MTFPPVVGASDAGDEVGVERFASLDADDVLTVYPPNVKLGAWTELTPEQAEQVAAQLIEAARLARL